MSETNEQSFELFLNKVEKKERTARLIGIGLTVLIFLVGVIVIATTVREIKRIQAELKETQQKLKDAKSELEKTKSELDQSLDFRKSIVTLNYMDIKVHYSDYRTKKNVLLDILHLREEGVYWKLGGTSEEEGFDSPSFAIYILRKNGVRVPTTTKGLLNSLTPVTDLNKAKSGDVIVYDAGYVMFYYKVRDKEFVIGMTPFGLLALDPRFAIPIEIGSPSY